MTELCMIITTTGAKDLAKKIASELVVSGLSMCAQISEVQSIYKWEGEVQEAHEYRLNIKAAKASEKAIVAKIKEMHDYDLPQIITVDISGGEEEYLRWIDSRHCQEL